MYFKIVGDITHVETFAVGSSIREVARLRKLYGRGRWRKRKGVARVRLEDGTVHLAELGFSTASLGLIVATDNPSAEFDLLYSQATELFKAFPEFQFKTVTALLVIIGWLVTSAGAQEFIRQNSSVAVPTTVIAFGLLLAFKFVWITGHYKRMRVMHGRLAALAPSKGLSVESVTTFELSPVLPITYLVVNVLLCSAVICVVLLICHPIAK